MGSKKIIGQTVNKKIGEIGMGSKKKKRDAALLAEQQKQNQINAYNTGERSRGTRLDNNFVAQKQAIVKKEGTVDYKKFLKSRLNDLTNILGVKR